MIKLFKLKFFILLILAFALSVFPQNDAEIQDQLVSALNNIQKYSSYGSDYDEEKLSDANGVFADKLLKYTKIASTLNYKFSQLDKLMLNATSDDGKFRIYSWDTEDGGTMHNFARVYQFQSPDGKVHSIAGDFEGEGDPGSFVYDIFTLERKTGAVYIVCSTAIGSTNDHFQSADLFQIGKTSFKAVKLLKTKSGLTNTLGFEYNFFSVVDREERPIRLIQYDKKTKTLKIPVVIEDNEFPNGKVTNKFISYKFNGKYFVKVK